MHPALPSGVHLKALETYSVIFSKTGPERLATEFIYRSVNEITSFVFLTICIFCLQRWAISAPWICGHECTTRLVGHL